MFEEHDLLRLQKSLNEFGMDSQCQTTSTSLPALYRYLEFYGFLHTLKGLPVEFYCGYRCCEGEAARWGRIATFHWRLNDARGTVLVVHGLFDHTGLYQNAVQFFLQQGYSVIAIDLPGHGLSDGEPTVVGSFDDYCDVLDDTLRYFHARKQGDILAFGQSTGAAVIARQCLRGNKNSLAGQYRAVILFAPLLRAARWPWVRLAYSVGSPLLRFIRRNFSPNSHDHTFNHFLSKEDVLQSSRLSVRWVNAMINNAKDFERWQSCKTPCLIVQGTADSVVFWRYNLKAYLEKFKGARKLIIKDAMHHITNEADSYRQSAFSGVAKFLAYINRA